MNGHSVYTVNPVGGDPIPARPQRRDEPESAPARTTVPQPPQPATVSRPVTVGALREARTAAPSTAAAPPRVPIGQRVKEPEVPARLRQKPKTVAFGVTTNVSQTVEREKDPHPAEPHRHTTTTTRRPPPAPAPAPRMPSTTPGCRPAGTRPATTGAAPRQPLAPAAARDENRAPAGGGAEEKEDSPLLAALREEVLQLRETQTQLQQEFRKHRETQSEQQRQIDKLIKIVTTLTERVVELEVEKEKGGEGGGRSRDSSGESDSRTRRRLNDEEEEDGGRRGRREEEQIEKDRLAAAALDRLAADPMMRRNVQDALEEVKYERTYGTGVGRRTASPPQRRGYFDEDDEPRAPAGRSAPSAAPVQRRKEEPRRVSPPRGGGGRGTGGGGVTRKKAEITPSRRRVTERVTMTRVHHFDESDDSDGAYDRFDGPRTQYEEEIVESADFLSAAYRPPQPARRNNRQQTYGSPRRGMPLIREVSDSEDELDRKRREIRERKEARERAGRR